jgi:hypothetical protein
MRQIDSKYQTSGTITKLDGTPIPDDEPLILFRAQDRLLSKLLDFYVDLRKQAGSSAGGIIALKQYVDKIKRWQAENSDRTRTPL